MFRKIGAKIAKWWNASRDAKIRQHIAQTYRNIYPIPKHTDEPFVVDGKTPKRVNLLTKNKSQIEELEELMKVEDAKLEAEINSGKFKTPNNVTLKEAFPKAKQAKERTLAD